MSTERIVIVGTGQGGFQVAASLVQGGFAGEIVLIGDEPGLPYQRPPLSKAYMKDGLADKLLLRSAPFFEGDRIRLADGVRVTSIDRSAKSVTTDSGEVLAYDHLVLATGARNASPPVANLDLEGVFQLRTLADAEAIRQRLPASSHAIVVGGGFIGLEFAAVASAAGLRVTVVEAMPRLMARAVSPTISERFKAAHEAWGVAFEIERFAAAVVRGADGRAAGLELSGGATIAGDLILIATGVRPNVELAEAAGLAVENGVVVDDLLATSDPAISALGDCCAFPEPTTGAMARLESVQAATDHARTIARRLLGTPEPYRAVPWFWSDQRDLKLQIAGLTAGADDWAVREQEGGKLAVLCFKAGLLLGVETVNSPGEHVAARKLLGGAAPVAKATLEAAGYDLRAVAKAQAA